MAFQVGDMVELKPIIEMIQAGVPEKLASMWHKKYGGRRHKISISNEEGLGFVDMYKKGKMRPDVWRFSKGINPRAQKYVASCPIWRVE